MVQDPRTEALAALASFLVAEVPLDVTLTHIAEITTVAMPAAAFAGLTLLGSDGRPTTAVFTDPDSPEIDAAQYTSGDGPCLDAWRRNQIIRLDDLAADVTPYGEFRAAALDHGIESTLSLPMRTGGLSVGAMNLYARTVNGFGDDDVALGEELAGVAAALLANAQAYWGAHQLSQQLDEALSSRAIIEQAKGMLMARTPGTSSDEAFVMLRAASQRENVKIREIAARIVDSNSAGPDTVPPT